jgi:hypothetical protein
MMPILRIDHDMMSVAPVPHDGVDGFVDARRSATRSVTSMATTWLFLHCGVHLLFLL